MRKYLVNVNGVSYEVEVEEMSAAEVKSAGQTQTAQPAAPKAEPKAQPKPVANGNGTSVSAPMPGTIKKVLVSNGKQVKKGEVLFILEAMKLENEIMSPVDGTITSVGTTEGSTVNPGDVLCTIA